MLNTRRSPYFHKILPISVPSASPENVKVQLLNVTSAQVLWHSPPRRDLHGDLKGYKVGVSVKVARFWQNYEARFSVRSVGSFTGLSKKTWVD